MKIKPVMKWELERYLLGELPGRRMDEIKKLLEMDSGLKEELASLKRSSEEILKLYPSEAVVPQIKAQVETQRKDRGREDTVKRPVLLKRLLYASPVLRRLWSFSLSFFRIPVVAPHKTFKGFRAPESRGPK